MTSERSWSMFGEERPDLSREEDSTPSLPKEVIQQDNRNISIRQSIRASFRVDVSLSLVWKNLLECRWHASASSCGVCSCRVRYLLFPYQEPRESFQEQVCCWISGGDDDSNSIVLSRTQLNNMTTYLRTYISKMKGAKTAIEYCEIGMTKDEFMSVYLLIEGRRNSSVMISHMTLVLPTRWRSLPTSLKSSKTHRTKWISVRWSVPSSIHWMTRYVLPSDWLMHRISTIVCCSSSMSMILMVRITCPNRTSKTSFQRCMSLIIATRLPSYAMYPSLPNSSSKDIEISINSIFIMKKGDNQGLFFFVYSMKSIKKQLGIQKHVSLPSLPELLLWSAY